MRLSDFLKDNDITYTAFADKIGSDKVSVRRYALRKCIPRPDVMLKIFEVTEGHVQANDFYDLPSGVYSHSPDSNGGARLQAASPSSISGETAGRAGRNAPSGHPSMPYELHQIEMFHAGVSS